MMSEFPKRMSSSSKHKRCGLQFSMSCNIPQNVFYFFLATEIIFKPPYQNFRSLTGDSEEKKWSLEP